MTGVQDGAVLSSTLRPTHHKQKGKSSKFGRLGAFTMIEDIRILFSFRGNRKRKRLKRILGPEATDYLIDLWIGAAIARPEGRLCNWDETDIADEANFPGDPQEFVKALTDCGFLERNGDCWVVHNWEKRQPWVVDAPLRQERARNAARAKWRKYHKRSDSDRDRSEIEPDSADRKRSASGGDPHQPGGLSGPHCGPDAGSNAPFPSLPFLSDDPDRGPESSRKYSDVIDPAIVKRIDRQADRIAELSSGRVNVYAFIQDCANRNYHPAAIAQTLEYIVDKWHDVRAFWPYARATASDRSRNFYGRQAEAESQQFKQIAVDDNRLRQLLKGIGDDKG